MLEACGIESPEELFAHLPEDVRLERPLDLAPGISEYEIVDYFRRRAAENANGYASFLGAGVYRHYRPVLVDTVVSRGEFLTSYTPYQAEISQGTLTHIFEFQTMMCQLTGMDVANASMYDGSTAVPEAAMMAARATGKGRVLVARSVHPEYREVLATYARHQGMPMDDFGYAPEAGAIDLEDLDRKLDDLTAAVIIQSPNFFGIVEHVKARGGDRPPPRRAAGGGVHRGRFAGDSGTARGRRYRGGRTAIVRHFAELRRPVRGRHRHQGEIPPADARPAGGPDHRFARQSRVLPDAGHARAAHPAREGHFQHLHQPGADRPHGHRLHERLRQAGPARAGRAEPGQGALPGGQAEAAILRARSSTSSWCGWRAARRTRPTGPC